MSSYCSYPRTFHLSGSIVQGGPSLGVPGLGWLWFGMCSQFCWFPIRPHRTRQREESQLNPGLPGDGPPCTRLIFSFSRVSFKEISFVCASARYSGQVYYIPHRMLSQHGFCSKKNRKSIVVRGLNDGYVLSDFYCWTSHVVNRSSTAQRPRGTLTKQFCRMNWRISCCNTYRDVLFFLCIENKLCTFMALLREAFLGSLNCGRSVI